MEEIDIAIENVGKVYDTLEHGDDAKLTENYHLYRYFSDNEDDADHYVIVRKNPFEELYCVLTDGPGSFVCEEL